MTAIGIDIGTFETRVAHCQRGQLRLLPLGLGDRHQFACASRLLVDEEMLVFGDLAVQLAGLSPQSLWTPNRFMVGDLKQCQVDAFGRSWTPELIAAAVLRAQVDASQGLIGRTIEHVVIAVPASFSMSAKDSLCRSIQLAGIDQLSLVEEFHAILYGWDVLLDGSSHLVIDWGHAGLKLGIVTASPSGLETAMYRMAPGAGGVRIVELLAGVWQSQLCDTASVAPEIVMGGGWEVLASRALQQLANEPAANLFFADFVDGKYVHVIATPELVSGLVRMVVDAGVTQIIDFIERRGANVASFASIQLFGGMFGLPCVRDGILQHDAFAKVFHLFVEAPTNAIVFGAIKQCEREAPGVSFQTNRKRTLGQGESQFEFGVRSFDAADGTVSYAPIVSAGSVLPCQVPFPLPSFPSASQSWVFDLVRRKNATSLLEEVGRWCISPCDAQDGPAQWVAEVTIRSDHAAQVRVVDTITGSEAECRFLGGMSDNNRFCQRDLEFLNRFDIYTRSTEPNKGLHRSNASTRQRSTGWR